MFPTVAVSQQGVQLLEGTTMKLNQLHRNHSRKLTATAPMHCHHVHLHWTIISLLF